jgi:alpha-beta hydrolase superfamily lysophospholipase
MRAWATALAFALGGCWHPVDQYCPTCIVVNERVIGATLPPLAADTRRVVILVHGAFGFGHEWDALVQAAQAQPGVAVVAFAWSGPWTRLPTLAAEALRRLVQAAVDQAPAGAEVLVIGHSAGGALAEYVAERLRVDGERRVRVVSVAAPELNLAPFEPERSVNTPLGVAMGGRQAPHGPIAAGVDFTAYATEDEPARALPAQPGVRRVWLGAHAGHKRSLTLAGLPLVSAPPPAR